MNECTFIIFGATGDLTRRKLIPALYNLVKDKKIEKILIVGAAWDDASAEDIFENAEPFVNNLDPDVWQKLISHTFYQQLNFKVFEDFQALKNLVERVEKDFDMNGNRIAYLATPAHFFCDITVSLGKSGLITRQKENPKVGWQRIVYEKPFGIDAQSASSINHCISQWFDESQIYRIDHYLTKELVGNIALVRFTNIIFEPLWNYKYIDNVQITLSEEIGLEGRGNYYDKYGVLRDVVQNHIMQLLALIAMEEPEQLSGDYIRDQKAKVLQKVHVTDGLLGQYIGYRKEKDVDPHSNTPTYSLLQMKVDTPRWKGVPFYLKSGKKLDKKNTLICIQFKEIYCPLEPGFACPANYLLIEVSPDARFALDLNIKVVGTKNEVMPVKMDFCHSCIYEKSTPESYEILFEQILAGEQSVSVRFDEIEYAWEIIDRAQEFHFPLYKYEPGSEGPKEAELFLKKHNVRWR